MMDKDIKAEFERIKNRLNVVTEVQEQYEEKIKTLETAVREMGKKNEEIKKRIELILTLVKKGVKVEK